MAVVCLNQVRDRYSNYSAVDWVSYGEVLQASSRIMDAIAYRVTTLSKAKAIHLPILVSKSVQDSEYAMSLRFNMRPDLSQL